MRVSGVLWGERAIRFCSGREVQMCKVGEVARGDAARRCGRKVEVSVRQVVSEVRRGWAGGRVTVIAMILRWEGVRLSGVGGIARRVVQGHGDG